MDDKDVRRPLPPLPFTAAIETDPGAERTVLARSSATATATATATGMPSFDPVAHGVSKGLADPS